MKRADAGIVSPSRATSANGPPRMGLEDQQPEAEDREIFDNQVQPHRQAGNRCDHRPQYDAGGVAGDAVDDGLFAKRLSVGLMFSATGLLVREEVSEKTERSGLECDQEEAHIITTGSGLFL